MIIDDKIRALESFEREVYSLTREVIVDNEAFIVEMNSEDQLFGRGVDANGRSIMEYAGPYSPVTIQIKLSKNQPTNRITLRDEGDFHAGFFIEAHDDHFNIWSTDDKTEELVFAWGESIFGLTTENLMEVAWEYLLPDLIKKLKQKLL